ncbi:glycoside hydrolase family 15 protein [Streptomyces diastaticus]|uniref:glycoside hydrolase family 15 protein n=3 Tax=Streptomyces diastaticus TaxID=1956 RepID=UPI001675A717|nr:glycoside hydrolase family 15 protein [Streptomyces diastaticus]GGU43035.1 glucoamylase [Streptomyces diastaticus subsp. diastaticus]
MTRRIEDYAHIGDMRSAAQVARDGSVDMLCLPRFDGPAVFTAMLGGEEHGYWRIAPSGPRREATRRRYLDDTLVLESEWHTRQGAVRVLDFMPPADAGAGAPQLIRIVEGISGAVPVTSAWAPRLAYGRVTPWICEESGRLVARAGETALWLDTDLPQHVRDGHMVHGEVTVAAGERVSMTMTWTLSHEQPPPPADSSDALARTQTFWREWAAACTYTGPYRAAVVRALITLKSLIYAPSGGIVAAPTTSLPEELGGGRNWDYRFTWLRDASVTLSSLLRTGYRDEARAWREWLLRAVAGDPENLQIMYGITGERDLPERTLPLPGFRGSAPVRIGNGAATQVQHDVYGEVIEPLTLAHEYGVAPCRATAALHIRLIESLLTKWREPDEGIWEVRGPRRHFVHSKVMAWVAVDRTIRLAESGALPASTGDVERWAKAREAIHREVCEQGFDAERNTFTQHYGSRELDASLLLIPKVGFLPPDDKRVIGTIDAVQRELATSSGLVYRYDTRGTQISADGLAGDEGAFILCSFWLVDSLALIGRVEEAALLFERLLGLRSDVGLLSEEIDPTTGAHLGNSPQAFSLLGLVESAVLLEDLHEVETKDLLGALA